MFRARGQERGTRGSPPELCKELVPAEGGITGSRTQNPVMTPLKWGQGHILPSTAGPRVCSHSPSLHTCCSLCSYVPLTSFRCALYGAHPSFSHLPTPWGQPLCRQPLQIVPPVGGPQGLLCVLSSWIILRVWHPCLSRTQHGGNVWGSGFHFLGLLGRAGHPVTLRGIWGWGCEPPRGLILRTETPASGFQPVLPA